MIKLQATTTPLVPEVMGLRLLTIGTMDTGLQASRAERRHETTFTNLHQFTRMS